MKKNIFMAIVLTLVLICSSSAFAAVTWTNAGSTGPAISGTVTGLMDDFKVSKNVTLVALSGVATYSAVSSHLNGGKVFGSSSGDSVIYTLNGGKTAGTPHTAAPTASDSSEFTSGWTVK